MRALIRRFDTLLRSRLSVFEFCDAPDCLLRVRVTLAAHAFSLPGHAVSEGAPVLELHLWNEHIPPLPLNGPDLAWAVQTRRKLVASFHTLADQMEHDLRFAAVQAVGGITVLLLPGKDAGGEKLFRRLGFSVYPHHGALGRFGEFWENLYTWWIMWTFNPATLRHRHLTRLCRTEIWMSAEEFSSRYGENEKEAPMSENKKTNLNYHVTVTQQNESHALAETRGHHLPLNVKKGAGEAGFNAAETLLAALGACILTNVNAIGEKMRLQIDAARMEFDAARRDEPPALTEIRYKLILKSPEAPEKLAELHDLCVKWGTVTNTLINGLTPQGELVIE
jgi:uncharacterized OsmC-like protein